MLKETFSSDSKYVDTDKGYSSINFGGVLKSFGNPLIGHEITEKISRFAKIRTYSKRKDVYFDDFIKPFLEEKVGSWIYDISPMKNLYLELRRREKNTGIGVELAKSEKELFRGWVSVSDSEKRDMRIRLLQEQYEHRVIKNAMHFLESKFGDVIKRKSV